jgi:hypothetical protein
MEHFGEYYLVTSSTRRGAGNDHEEVDVEGEHAPSSWVGQRVRLVTIQEADRTSHEEALLLYLDQLGITIRRPLIPGGEEEEVVFHPWVHVYQLGPLMD